LIFNHNFAGVNAALQPKVGVQRLPWEMETTPNGVVAEVRRRRRMGATPVRLTEQKSNLASHENYTRIVRGFPEV
jgi:hypothetical protein